MRPFGSMRIKGVPSESDKFLSDGEPSYLYQGHGGSILVSCLGRNDFVEAYVAISQSNFSYNHSYTVSGTCIGNPPNSGFNIVPLIIGMRYPGSSVLLPNRDKMYLVGHRMEWPQDAGYTTTFSLGNPTMIGSGVTIPAPKYSPETTGNKIKPPKAIVSRLITTPSATETAIIYYVEAVGRGAGEKFEKLISLEGMFVVPPGSFCAVTGSPSTAVGRESIVWAEVPI